MYFDVHLSFEFDVKLSIVEYIFTELRLHSATEAITGGIFH